MSLYNEFRNPERREAARMEAQKWFSLGFRFEVDSAENDNLGYLEEDPDSYLGVPMTEDTLVDYDNLVPTRVPVTDTRTGIHLTHPFFREGFLHADNFGEPIESFYGALGLDPDNAYHHMIFQELGKLTRQDSFATTGDVPKSKFLEYLDDPKIREFWGEVGYLHFVIMFGLREVSTLSSEERQTLIGMIRSRRTSTLFKFTGDAAQYYKTHTPKIGITPNLEMQVLSEYVLEDPELSFEFMCYLVELGYAETHYPEKEKYFSEGRRPLDSAGIDKELADTLLLHLQRHPSNKEMLLSYVRDVVRNPARMDSSFFKDYYLSRGQNAPIMADLESALSEF